MGDGNDGGHGNDGGQGTMGETMGEETMGDRHLSQKRWGNDGGQAP